MPEQPIIRPLSRAEVREVDRRTIKDFGLPGVVLMENAGRGATDVLVDQGISGIVTILTGKGNNGGDGYVIARFLQLYGIECRIASTCDPNTLTGDARIQMLVARNAGLPISAAPDVDQLRELIDTADWIIDGLLGTGATGAARSPMDEWIRLTNASTARVIAIDVPSGLDCDTGRAAGVCIAATDTITFVAPKVGFQKAEAASHVGEVHVVPIGAPLAVLAEFILDP
ncbi:MAG: NAD(P)H-hydrate epimerase [Planctomycetaceae bacterium]